MNWKAFWNESAQVRDSDFCRQVGRTFRGESCSHAQIDSAVDHLRSLLTASADKTLLDIGCGNGLVTSRLAQHFRHITAVDFSRPLIEIARLHFRQPNVEYVVDDAARLEQIHGPVDCVLVSAALQHLSQRDARRMFERLRDLVEPRGRILLADVPDRARMWNFYAGAAGRLRYVQGLLARRPIIGHWWTVSALRRLGDVTGWHLEIHYQPQSLPNHYFRFDATYDVQ